MAVDGVTFERTSDFALVRAVLTDATQYRMACDDSALAPEYFRANEHPAICYLIARGDEGDMLGILSLLPENAVTWQIHAALLPRSWGKHTRPALIGAVRYAFATLGARRVTAAIPAYNRLAIRLALDCGFVAFGRNRASFLRHGALHDQVLLGVSKP